MQEILGAVGNGWASWALLYITDQILARRELERDVGRVVLRPAV